MGCKAMLADSGARLGVDVWATQQLHEALEVRAKPQAEPKLIPAEFDVAAGLITAQDCLSLEYTFVRSRNHSPSDAWAMTVVSTESM